MDRRNGQVTILCWRGGAEAHRIVRAVQQLGCAAWPCTVGEFLSSGRPERQQAGAVVVTGGADLPTGDLERLVSAAWPAPCIAVMPQEAGQGAESVARQCFDFLSWPCCEAELRMRLDRALDSSGEAHSGHRDPQVWKRFAQLELIGESDAFVRSLRLMARLARCDAPVLVHGETGTGKELAARALHYLGDRRDHPFVPVNCGAIPDNLLENELFGHVRGAFTDARETQTGLVARAHLGTLFLDEIDALSHRAQVTLLRFLQDQEYTPLGGSATRRADVRVIAASNTSLEAMADRGEFRMDLLFRLDIVSIELPPLRAREGDIELLAEHFLQRFSRDQRQAPKVLHTVTRQWMRSHPWPGNVRELENFMLRCVVVCEGPVICTQGRPDIGDGVNAARLCANRVDFSTAKARAVCEFERGYLCELMGATRGNVSAAARLAGKERRALGRLLKKHGIDRSLFAGGAVAE